MANVNVHRAILQQNARQREAAQAAPRPARVRFIVRTVGVGESRLIGSTALNFNAYMLEEPTFSWGVVAVDPLPVGMLPFCTATVLTYRTSSTGLYTGAELGFKIESLKTDIHLKFDLTFEGSTLRSTSGVDSASTVAAPRSTNTFLGTTNVDPSGI